MKKQMFNNRGQSLIQVMVTAAITIVVMFAMISVQLSSARENKALGEKLASLDFLRSVTASVSSQIKCSSLLTASNIVGGAASLTFDATPVTATTPYSIKLNSIFGTNAGATVSPLASSLFLNTVAATPSGIQINVTSPTTANVVVSFDSTRLVRALASLSFPIVLQSSGPTTATLISGCGGQSTAMSGMWCGIQWNGGGWQATTHPCTGPPVPAGTAMTCPVGFTFTAAVMVAGNFQWVCIKD